MNDSELEIFCAEKVMGWKTHAVSDRLWYTGSNSIAKDRFHPLTSISDAFMLVDKMKDRDMWFRLIGPDFSGTDNDGLWWAGFTVRGHAGWNGRMDFERRATTIPRAIALAAVAALEAKT